MAGTPIEAVKEALEKLEEAQKDLNKARAEIQGLKNKVESLETQLAEKANLTTFQDTEKTLTQSIQKVEGLANNAQSTANSADATATSAQQTANSAVANSVKNIKFFTVTATINTTSATSEVVVDFPERVDAVALESIMNDGHDMWIGAIDRINDTTFKVRFLSARGEGARWIPSLRFTGIQVQR